ncbi:hypothetical protein [Desulfofundulus thermosubterraneus]|uniref:hypothetical protein n=1 Tax=Desulfofundulus thermosubterraneus TaxID=348840 RepID=UPI0013F4EB11|nr:hypothetical protein [Desulfofundulus thermosubterraneus]
MQALKGFVAEQASPAWKIPQYVNYFNRILEMGQAEGRQVRGGDPAVFAVVTANENAATEICRDDAAR